MKKLLLACAVSSLPVAPATVMAQTEPAAAPASPNTFTANVSLVSDYRFRGVSQSFKLPAVQGGFDYSHESGIYLGNWNSSVSGNSYPNGASLEMDFYGGWKKTFDNHFGMDIGVLYYYYPGSKYEWIELNPIDPLLSGTGSSQPNSFEGYIGASWQWLSFKYSYAFTNYFGLTSSAAQNFFVDTSGQSAAADKGYGILGRNAKDSKGTMYFDLSATYPLIEKLNLTAHVGYLRVANYSQYNYTDYKLGLTYELPNSWVIGAAFIGTDADSDWYTTCNGSGDCKQVADDTGVVSLSKTF